MLIECILKKQPGAVSISDDSYAFERNEKGAFVAEVQRDMHVRAFLAREDAYREYKPEAEPEPRKHHPDPHGVIAVKGIGEAIVEKLATIDVTTLAQIAAWTPQDAANVEQVLKLQPRGRIGREKWVEQANALLGHPLDPGRKPAGNEQPGGAQDPAPSEQTDPPAEPQEQNPAGT